MPNFKRITPVLKVSDMRRSMAFYTGIVGFEVVYLRKTDDGDDICMLQSARISLLLSTGSHLGVTPCFSGTLYFDMDDVAAFFARVKDAAPIVWPLEHMDYGQTEFGIRDPDGYILAFAQPDSEPDREPTGAV